MPMLSLPAMTDEEIRAAQARKLKERELDLLRQVASRALERGHAAIVEGLLGALVARAPEDAGVRYLVGASLAREAATAEKALDHLRRAEELGNDAFQTRLAVVEAHRALGDEAAARRETERAVEVRVGSVLGAAQLGRFVVECWELHRQGRHRLVALLAALSPLTAAAVEATLPSPPLERPARSAAAAAVAKSAKLAPSALQKVPQHLLSSLVVIVLVKASTRICNSSIVAITA
jgi:hypothetical protein